MTVLMNIYIHINVDKSTNLNVLNIPSSCKDRVKFYFATVHPVMYQNEIKIKNNNKKYIHTYSFAWDHI